MIVLCQFLLTLIIVSGGGKMNMQEQPCIIMCNESAFNTVADFVGCVCSGENLTKSESPGLMSCPVLAHLAVSAGCHHVWYEM